MPMFLTKSFNLPAKLNLQGKTIMIKIQGIKELKQNPLMSGIALLSKCGMQASTVRTCSHTLYGNSNWSADPSQCSMQASAGHACPHTAYGNTHLSAHLSQCSMQASAVRACSHTRYGNSALSAATLPQTSKSLPQHSEMPKQFISSFNTTQNTQEIVIITQDQIINTQEKDETTNSIIKTIISQPEIKGLWKINKDGTLLHNN